MASIEATTTCPCATMHEPTGLRKLATMLYDILGMLLETTATTSNLHDDDEGFRQRVQRQYLTMRDELEHDDAFGDYCDGPVCYCMRHALESFYRILFFYRARVERVPAVFAVQFDATQCILIDLLASEHVFTCTMWLPTILNSLQRPFHELDSRVSRHVVGGGRSTFLHRVILFAMAVSPCKVDDTWFDVLVPRSQSDELDFTNFRQTLTAAGLGDPMDRAELVKSAERDFE